MHISFFHQYLHRSWMALIALVSLVCCSTAAMAQNDMPTIAPTATYTTFDGHTEQSADFSGQAPLTGHFEANSYNTDGWTCNYEWRFYHENEQEPYLIRYEEDTEYTFTTSGTHSIMLYAKFTRGAEETDFTEEYWSEHDPLKVTIHESNLVMPNAFSPNNGDRKNDTYKAKTYQSLVEFHATIYNRWGQKLYEWDDPAGGWDGTFNGREVKQGVYFVVVRAKGADGKEYNIRRDVNLLRGYTEATSGAAP